MKRALIFAHYNKYDELSSYVLYWLEKLQPLFKKMVFVSNSDLSPDNQNKIKQYTDDIIIHENTGYDFGAWKYAIAKTGFDSLAGYDSLTLMNDTGFGPLYDLQNIYDLMEQKSIDFWGLTNHRATPDSMPGTDGPVPEHLQSYFLVFNKAVITSKVFQNFWKDMPYYEDRNKLIQNCETQLTPLLQKNGFSYMPFIDTSEDTFTNDIAINYPELLIKRNIPLIKIKRFRNFSHPKYLRKMISDAADYPLKLIDEHITNSFIPNETIKSCNKNLFLNSASMSANTSLKTAIHIHVFYDDIFQKLVNLLDEYKIDSDLFITTNSKEIKESIELSISNTRLKSKLKRIYIYPNHGRNILPWINIAEELNKYDLVGHFHTKKSVTAEEWVGKSWLDENLDFILKPANQILLFMEKNKDMGLIIPDMAFYFKYLYQNNLWGGNQEICQNLWDKMKNRKAIDFKNLALPIMPIGFMFWYRPKALKPFFELGLNKADFPEEPIPTNQTILHAIERLFVYLAWSEGYDYRVAINKNNASSGFDIKSNLKTKKTTTENIEAKNNEIKFLNKRLEQVYKSYNWKLGRFLLWLPKKIINLFKR